MDNAKHCCVRWGGASVGVLLLVWCTFSLFAEAMAPLITNSPLAGIVLTGLFLLVAIPCYYCFFLCALRDPGPLRPWLAVSKVEQFVRAELVKWCGTLPTSSSGKGTEREGDAHSVPVRKPANATNLQAIDDAEKHMSANVMLSAAFQRRLEEREEDADAAEEDLVSDDEEDGDEAGDAAPAKASDGQQTQRPQKTPPRGGNRSAERPGRTAATVGNKGLWSHDLDQPREANGWVEEGDADDEDATGLDSSALARRRHRRRRHGMAEQTVEQLAQNALRLIDGNDAEAKERQMDFLLRGARFCRFCQVYKLQETHHCSSCQRCIYGMDHHCPWIGQCVGFDNFKYFLLFVWYLFWSTVFASIIGVLVVSRGYNFFFTETESNPTFFFTFAFTTSFCLVLLPFFIQHLYDLGRGQSTVIQLEREDRELLRQYARRVGENGAAYEIAFEEEDAPAPGKFFWSNLRRAFGDGRVFPDWLIPSPPPRPPITQQEEAFWQDLRSLIERQLRTVADATEQREAHVAVTVETDVAGPAHTAPTGLAQVGGAGPAAAPPHTSHPVRLEVSDGENNNDGMDSDWDTQPTALTSPPTVPVTAVPPHRSSAAASAFTTVPPRMITATVLPASTGVRGYQFDAALEHLNQPAGAVAVAGATAMASGRSPMRNAAERAAPAGGSSLSVGMTGSDGHLGRPTPPVAVTLPPTAVTAPTAMTNAMESGAAGGGGGALTGGAGTIGDATAAATGPTVPPARMEKRSKKD